MQQHLLVNVPNEKLHQHVLEMKKNHIFHFVSQSKGLGVFMYFETRIISLCRV